MSSGISTITKEPTLLVNAVPLTATADELNFFSAGRRRSDGEHDVARNAPYILIR